jgi:hypothetical protein
MLPAVAPLPQGRSRARACARQAERRRMGTSARNLSKQQVGEFIVRIVRKHEFTILPRGRSRQPTRCGGAESCRSGDPAFPFTAQIHNESRESHSRHWCCWSSAGRLRPQYLRAVRRGKLRPIPCLVPAGSRRGGSKFVNVSSELRLTVMTHPVQKSAIGYRAG